MENLEQNKVKKSLTLEEKLAELEAKTKKIKNEIKAKQQAELRKKHKAEEKRLLQMLKDKKELLQIFLSYSDKLNNNALLLEGVLINCVKNLADNNQDRLNYFYGLVQNKNN